MKNILAVLGLIAHFSVNAAPIPAMSTSLLTNEKPGIFRSVKGFTVHSGKTEWVLEEPPADLPSVVTLYKSPESHKGVQPVMTVRVDELGHKMDLKNYVKQWMKDYSLLGFNVINTKTLKVNTNTAFAMDVEESKGDKKLRQLVFLKDQIAVVLTCRDRKETFQKTVKDCNEIFRSFEWNSSKPASSQGQTGA